MQDINKECVVLEEVINLETAAIADSKISKKFAVVGCGGANRMGVQTIAKQGIKTRLTMSLNALVHLHLSGQYSFSLNRKSSHSFFLHYSHL